LETFSLTKTKYKWKSHTPLDRCTAHRSALANLIIAHIHLYRAQYSTGHQSCLSNEDQVTSAVEITEEIFSIYNIFASAETTDYYLELVMFLAMQYLKHMCTDHSCIQNFNVENKHLYFENHFPDQNQIQLEITYSTRQMHSSQKCFG